MSFNMITGAVMVATTLLGTETLGARPAPDNPRVIEVIADKDNTFKVPGEKKAIMTVKPGERVILRITSHFGGEQSRDGSVHSFVVKKLREQEESSQQADQPAASHRGPWSSRCRLSHRLWRRNSKLHDDEHRNWFRLEFKLLRPDSRAHGGSLFRR